MTSTERFRVRHPKVVHQTIDGEVIIINMDTGTYYSLSGSGAAIWESIAREARLDEIVGSLAERYDGTIEAFGTAVGQILDRLREEGLIVPTPDRPDLPRARGLAPEPGASSRLPFEAPVLEKYVDMQDLILLDPVHEVDETEGWPHTRPAGGS